MRATQLCLAIVLLVLVSVAFASIQGGGRRATEERVFLENASPSIADVPVHLGEWRMVDETPLTERALSILKCRDHLNRIYVADSSGERVMVSILLGPAGPLVSHSPEVCMASTKYQLVSPSSPVDLLAGEGRKLPVKRATFQAKDVSGELVRVYYAWVRPDGTWVAPASPRWVLGGERGLWKVQVTTTLSALEASEFQQTEAGDAGPSDGGLERDAAERFLIENSETMRELFQAYRAG